MNEEVRDIGPAITMDPDGTIHETGYGRSQDYKMIDGVKYVIRDTGYNPNDPRSAVFDEGKGLVPKAPPTAPDIGTAISMDPDGTIHESGYGRTQDYTIDNNGTKNIISDTGYNPNDPRSAIFDKVPSVAPSVEPSSPQSEVGTAISMDENGVIHESGYGRSQEYTMDDSGVKHIISDTGLNPDDPRSAIFDNTPSVAPTGPQSEVGTAISMDPDGTIHESGYGRTQEYTMDDSGVKHIISDTGLNPDDPRSAIFDNTPSVAPTSPQSEVGTAISMDENGVIHESGYGRSQEYTMDDSGVKHIISDTGLNPNDPRSSIFDQTPSLVSAPVQDNSSSNVVTHTASNFEEYERIKGELEKKYFGNNPFNNSLNISDSNINEKVKNIQNDFSNTYNTENNISSINNQNNTSSTDTVNYEKQIKEINEQKSVIKSEYENNMSNIDKRFENDRQTILHESNQRLHDVTDNFNREKNQLMNQMNDVMNNPGMSQSEKSRYQSEINNQMRDLERNFNTEMNQIHKETSANMSALEQSYQNERHDLNNKFDQNMRNLDNEMNSINNSMTSSDSNNNNNTSSIENNISTTNSNSVDNGVTTVDASSVLNSDKNAEAETKYNQAVNEYNDKKAEVKKEYKNNKESILRDNATQIKKANQKYQEKRNQVENTYNKLLNDPTKSEQEKESIRNERKAHLKSLEVEHNQQISNINKKTSANLSQLEDDFKAKKKELKSELKSNVKNINGEYKTNYSDDLKKKTDTTNNINSVDKSKDQDAVNKAITDLNNAKANTNSASNIPATAAGLGGTQPYQSGGSGSGGRGGYSGGGAGGGGRGSGASSQRQPGGYSSSFSPISFVVKDYDKTKLKAKNTSIDLPDTIQKVANICITFNEFNSHFADFNSKVGSNEWSRDAADISSITDNIRNTFSQYCNQLVKDIGDTSSNMKKSNNRLANSIDASKATIDGISNNIANKSNASYSNTIGSKKASKFSGKRGPNASHSKDNSYATGTQKATEFSSKRGPNTTTSKDNSFVNGIDKVTDYFDKKETTSKTSKDNNSINTLDKVTDYFDNKKANIGNNSSSSGSKLSASQDNKSNSSGVTYLDGNSIANPSSGTIGKFTDRSHSSGGGKIETSGTIGTSSGRLHSGSGGKIETSGTIGTSTGRLHSDGGGRDVASGTSSGSLHSGGGGRDVAIGTSSVGLHSGGGGRDVAIGTSSVGLHSGGGGRDVAIGTSSVGLHSGGGGRDVASGTSSGISYGSISRTLETPTNGSSLGGFTTGGGTDVASGLNSLRSFFNSDKTMEPSSGVIVGSNSGTLGKYNFMTDK